MIFLRIPKNMHVIIIVIVGYIVYYIIVCLHPSTCHNLTNVNITLVRLGIKIDFFTDVFKPSNKKFYWHPCPSGHRECLELPNAPTRSIWKPRCTRPRPCNRRRRPNWPHSRANTRTSRPDQYRESQYPSRQDH